MSNTDWRDAALHQKVRAEKREIEAADLKHALNLLVNDAVDWYASYKTPDGQTHKFGIGVAANVEIRDRIKAVIVGRKSEHRTIVFWITEEPRDDGGPTKYLTVYNMDEFRSLPAAVKENKEVAEFSALLEKAIEGLDEAYKNYFKSRSVGGRVM
jgi:hypothetical protein